MAYSAYRSWRAFFCPSILGERWLPVQPFLQILALAGVVNLLRGNSRSILLLSGSPHRAAQIAAMRFVAVIPFVLVGIYTAGPIGAAWGVLVSGTALTIVSLLMVQRQLDCRGIEFLYRLWRPALAVALMALIVFSLRGTWATSGDFVSIVIEAVVSIGAGAIIYIGSLFAFWWLAGRPDGAESRFLNLCVQFRKKR